MQNVISEVIQEDLYSGCGVCAVLCPSSALSMEFQDNGDFAPRVDAVRCLEKCHLCVNICPFSGGVYNPRKTNIQFIWVRLVEN